MRKQYHFWKSASGDGLDAWDVDRLIELSAGLPVVQFPTASLAEVDSVYWFDNDQHRPTVRSIVDHVRLIRAADPSYPIILGPDGRVMDGMHRIDSALLANEDMIRAVRFSALPDADHTDCSPSDLSYDR